MSSARASISCSAASLLRSFAPFLLLFISLTAASQDIGLRAAGPDQVTVRTRQTLSLMLFVDNLRDAPLELLLETVLPEGWRELTADGSFRVVFLAEPKELAGIYDSIAAFTAEFLKS